MTTDLRTDPADPAATPDPGGPMTSGRAARLLDGLTDEAGVLAGSPDGPGWVPANQLAAPDQIDLAADRMAVHTGGIPKVTAAYLTGWVTCTALWPVVAAPVAIGHRVTPAPSQVRVGWHADEHWIDRVALAEDLRWTPLGRPAAADVAAGAGAIVGPLVDALARRRWLGRRALWGAVADGVTWMALEAAHLAGWEDEDAMALATELVAGLPMAPGPHQFVSVHRGEAHRLLRLKQACCLAYTTPSHEGRYCLTCPFETEDGRSARYDALFDQE